MENEIKTLFGKTELYKINNCNKKSTERKRHYGIDLFKIFATINVVILHINSHSGLIKHNLNNNSSKFKKIWCLEIFAYWAVNGFGIISGFVGYKRHRFSNLIYLWVEVLFYSLFLSIFLFFIKEISYYEVFLSFFPLLIRRHWYVNAYFWMYLILPFINEGIKNLKQKVMKNIIIFCFFFFSFYHIISKIIKIFEYNYLNNGYSTNWLIILYIIGAYFGKYVLKNKNNKTITYFIFWFFIYFICSFFTLMFYLKKIKFKKIANNIFINYLSPTILFQAISLLMFFSKLDIENRLVQRIINNLNPLNFSVIMIHGRLFPYKKISSKIFFNLIKDYKGDFILTKICLLSILIYIFSVLIDSLRLLLFRLLKIRNLCKLIENNF